MTKLFDFKTDIPLGIQYGDYDSKIVSSSQQWEKYYAIDGKLP